MSVDHREFDLPFFRENGFVRKRCDFCKSYFWTQVDDSRDCGDSPCQEYTFIGNPPTNRQYTLPEIRETFLRFFERNGHRIIKPYPVVARWRDDVYFTGASIFDFQPYVTEGIIPPPANPLVISQPCLRFTDIDNAGPTMGRHLTIFEMGGAHAFNSAEKEVYWKDQTVRYHHELITKQLGVKSELVKYKEDFWRGGGNAGPDLEATVMGLEISTLVFMSYKIVGEALVEMPIRTVDTGYGIERWAWLSQGSSNGFEPVYGPVIDKIAGLAGISIDEKLIEAVSRLSGVMAGATATDRSASRELVAKRLGMEKAELERLLLPLENVFAVADHTKATGFILSEGVVPSNVHEGYLVRLLIRRTCRLLKALGIEDRLQDIVEMQIANWSEDFPNLESMRGEILRLLEVEQEKYHKTLERGQELVRRVAGRLKDQGKRRMPTETLVEMYDSQGLVPDVVSEVATAEGIAVEVPPDFYSLVAQRMTERPAQQETDLEMKIKERTASLPATRLLYYEDAYMRKFEANVVATFEDQYFVLNQTCFYAEGGGQPSDQGRIQLNGRDWKIVDAQRIGNVTIHTTDHGVPPVGETVEGEIEWDRRIALMRHHSAAHILMGAARRVLGAHAWQAGARKDVERARLDISHYEKLSLTEVEKIERLANDAVLRDIPIKVEWMPREKAEQAYGFRLYQGGVVPGREIRVVSTGDWEVEACGGTHCRSTGEVGMIKIVHADRIQDGVERLTFVAGLSAVDLIQSEHGSLMQISELVGTSISEAVKAVQVVTDENRLLRRQVESWRRKSLKSEAQTMLSNAQKIRRLKLVTARRDEDSEEDAVALSDTVAKMDGSAVCVLLIVKDSVRVIISAGEKAIKAGIHAGKIAAELAKLIGGSGGGKPYFGQGGGTTTDRADEVLDSAKEIVRKVRA